MTPCFHLPPAPRGTSRALIALTLALAGCGPAETPPEDASFGERSASVVLDTRTARARAQYDANVAFARGYLPRCTARGPRPRVLVTGFGRFLTNAENATGRMVAALGGFEYPLTDAPAWGEVDLPEPQTRGAQTVWELPHVGSVDVCALVLPVSWDLAAVLVTKELEAFRPDLVLMNGIARERQPVWLELGAVNRAMLERDGSSALKPYAPPGGEAPRLVPQAPAEELLRGQKLSWQAARAAVVAALEAAASVEADGVRFDEVARGVQLAGFPRPSNTYLCNNLSYVVGYLMDHPRRSISLMQASEPVPGSPNRVWARLSEDLSDVPRVFVHWPSGLKGAHLEAAGEALKALVDAQLNALAAGELPQVGDNAWAELRADED